MRMLKIAALSLTAAATLAAGTAPAVAAPKHKHKVCKVERVKGHKKTVCRWVR